MSVNDLVNKMLEAAPVHDANGFLRVLKLAQAILDEKHAPYPRAVNVPLATYRALSADGAKFLETPNSPAASGLIYGFYLVVDPEIDTAYFQSL